MEQCTLTQSDQNSSLYAASPCQEVEADNYCFGVLGEKKVGWVFATCYNATPVKQCGGEGARVV